MEKSSANPREDIQAIREIMERSSRYLSLSGLSGIFAGACALAGSVAAWLFILKPGAGQHENMQSLPVLLTGGPGLYLTLDAMLVLAFAVLGAVWFSYRKAGRTGQPFLTQTTRRLVFHLLVPLVSGGIFTIILVFRNNPELVASVMLVFYGLSLVNAGKFTFSEIQYLGLTEIVLGLLAGLLPLFGLLFWAAGFGLMHIIYGTVMYYRHDG